MEDRTVSQLITDAEASYQQAKASHDAASAVRETTWRLASEHDWTVRRIAALAGVSFQLVGRVLGRGRTAQRDA